MAPTNLYEMCFLIPKNVTSERPIARFANSAWIVGVVACARGVEMARKASCCVGCFLMGAMEEAEHTVWEKAARDGKIRLQCR